MTAAPTQRIGATSGKTRSAVFTSLLTLDPLIIFIAFSLLHVLMLSYDFSHPDAFLHADRAPERLQAVQDLINIFQSKGPIAPFLATHGNVGDYLFHALLYEIGGPVLIIIVQCALMIAAGIAVYNITWLISARRNISAFAMIIFLMLPHNLAFPHMLSTEALFLPLIVIAFYLLATFCLVDQAPRKLILSGSAYGIAALVRPVSFLWPLIAGLILLAFGAHKKAVTKLVAYSFVPMLVWMGVMWSLTGQFNEGSSNHDLTHNLASRLTFISQKLGDQEREVAREHFLQFHVNEATGLEEASLRQYAEFCAAYPSPCLAHLTTDLLAFFAKSGIEKITVEYLSLAGDTRYQFQDMAVGWRSRLEHEGLVGVGKYFLELNWVIAISSALGLAGILCLWLLALVGAWTAVVRLRASTPLTFGYVVILLLFPAYVWGVSQFIDEVQSRHRAPCEFALCIFAAIGLYRRDFKAPVSPVV
jgi:4-amino-4-deoxy-L-arabinose transferase-like glycosyltransferase